MQLTPLFDTVFVERTCKDFDKTTSKIILPDSVKEEGKRVYEGKVLHVGPGVHHEKSGVFIETTIKAGDAVMFGRFIPNIIQLEGKEVYVLKENQIYAKLN